MMLETSPYNQLLKPQINRRIGKPLGLRPAAPAILPLNQHAISLSILF
jgi:hypothetical protein